MKQMNKITIEVDDKCTSGSIALSNDEITGKHLMHAACMLIDFLLENEVISLGEVLEIVADIPNAVSTSETPYIYC